jgi:hypothetical protein
MKWTKSIIRLTGATILLILLTAGCGSVPKEVVELSYVMGEDLQSINQSYDNLIHQFYNNLRDQRRAYIDDVWYPRFVENWRKDGELVAIAKEERIWSESEDKLVVVPAGSVPKESLAALNDWLDYALYAYEKKSEALLSPLDQEEETLRTEVRVAFARMTQANATITAHLNSLREIKEVEDQALKALNLKDLRDQINDQLVNASKKAKDGLDKIKEVDQKVDKFGKKLKD